MGLVTPGVDGAGSFILGMRSRLLAEATVNAQFGALITFKEIIQAEPGRRTGITYATKLRAARELMRMNGLLR